MCRSLGREIRDPVGKQRGISRPDLPRLTSRTGVSWNISQGMNLLGDRPLKAQSDLHGTLNEPCCRLICAQDAWVVERGGIFGQPVTLYLLKLTENDRALGPLDGTLARATKRPEKELMFWPIASVGQDTEHKVVADLVPFEGRLMQVDEL